MSSSSETCPAINCHSQKSCLWGRGQPPGAATAGWRGRSLFQLGDHGLLGKSLEGSPPPTSSWRAVAALSAADAGAAWGRQQQQESLHQGLPPECSGLPTSPQACVQRRHSGRDTAGASGRWDPDPSLGAAGPGECIRPARNRGLVTTPVGDRHRGLSGARRQRMWVVQTCGDPVKRGISKGGCPEQVTGPDWG